MFKYLKQIKRNWKKAKNRRYRKDNPKTYSVRPQKDTSSLKAHEFEFLIKRVQIGEGEYFDDFNLKSEADWLGVLTPDSVKWSHVNDPRGFTIKLDKFSYGIADEFAGLQIAFEGNVTFEEARNLLLELKSKLEQFSGFEAEIIDFY
ncbi:MAG: hypothetical protein R2799_04880 [Crocinitomicaceae bacterium]